MDENEFDNTQWEEEHSDYDPYDDYGGYDPYEDNEPELLESSFSLELVIARVHKMLMVTVTSVTGNRYSGQDWGEAEFYECSKTGQPSELFKKKFALAVREYAKDLADGQFTKPLSMSDIQSDDEDED